MTDGESGGEEECTLHISGRTVTLTVSGANLAPKSFMADLEAMTVLALGSYFEGLPAGAQAADISVAVMDDAAIRTLNREWRGFDKPTNVLSFAAVDIDALDDFFAVPQTIPLMLGDMALSVETLDREAAEQGKPHDHHLKHLILHSLLHLLGYDHEEEEDAEVMEALETRLLGQIGIPDPYQEQHP